MNINNVLHSVIELKIRFGSFSNYFNGLRKTLTAYVKTKGNHKSKVFEYGVIKIRSIAKYLIPKNET